eukprot:EG_transcript_48825
MTQEGGRKIKPEANEPKLYSGTVDGMAARKSVPYTHLRDTGTAARVFRPLGSSGKKTPGPGRVWTACFRCAFAGSRPALLWSWIELVGGFVQLQPRPCSTRRVV